MYSTFLCSAEEREAEEENEPGVTRRKYWLWRSQGWELEIWLRNRVLA